MGEAIHRAVRERSSFNLIHEETLVKADIYIPLDEPTHRGQLERSRRIHSYLDGSFAIEKLRGALDFMREYSNFVPAAIVIEGYEFADATTEEIAALRETARGVGAELWLSAVTHRESATDDRGVPEPVARLAPSIDVILRMVPEERYVHISLLKDHDNPEVSDLNLALDPTTMLLVKE